jgi:hypothetical protein
MTSTQKFSNQDSRSNGTQSGRPEGSSQTEQRHEHGAGHFYNHHDYDDGLVHGHSWAPASHTR